MSGKLCDGLPDNAPYLRDSKAFCEGRAAAAAGALVDINPHPDGSQAAVAWSSGHATWADDPALGPELGQDCCADAFGGGYTP
jgi:hypothetical protein